MLEQWTHAVLRRRGIVLSVWTVLIAVGVLAGSHLNDRLTTSVSVPGSDSSKVDQILVEHFHENIEGTFTVFFPFHNATPSEIKDFKVKIATAVKSVPSARVNQERAIAGVLFVSIATKYSLTDASKYTTVLRKALAGVGLSKALVTGPAAIKSDVTPVLNSDLQRGQLIAILIALLLLLLVLGFCWAVFAPFLFALATISVTLCAIYLLSLISQVMLYTPNIVELMGLGLAIDYSLLMVHRFRRELSQSPEISGDEAVLRTMLTAGRTVVISGATVSIGLATLLFVPVPFVRSLGAAGLIVPIVSTIAALTLQPALLSLVGVKGISTRGFGGLINGGDPLNGVWAKIARLAISKPKTIFFTSLLVLLVSASSVLWLEITPSTILAIPKNLESAKALSIVTDRAGNGVITPHEIIIDLGKPNQAATPAVKSARMAFATSLGNDSETFVVANGEKVPYVDPTGRYLRFYLVGNHDLGAAKTQRYVAAIRTQYIPSAKFPAGTKIYLGGAPAQGVDLLNRIKRSVPWIIALVLLLVYLLLLRAFRSAVLPLKAIAMDLLSVIVAYGSLVTIFKFGWGSALLGTYRLDQIEIWVLVFLFASLFGLSMDYEVFIVSRIREAWDRGATNEEAIIEGLANTGGVVTAAAIIFVGALSGMVGGHFAVLQQLGVGLGCGVLIDATVIRGLLLPSAMVLLGKWNWWLPVKVGTAVAPPQEQK